MIDKITYKDIDIEKVEVIESSKEFQEKIKSIKILRRGCLINSYKISKATKALMVEGYLVTTFHNKKDIDCVGHVWNCLDGKYFDETAKVIVSTDVKENFYFPVIIYEFSEAKIVPKMKFAFPISFENIGDEIQFKSDCKNDEKEVRKDLNVNKN